MDVQALRRLELELDLFLERYAPHFGRDEAQEHAHRFVQGLLLGGDRRSVENIAEAIDGCVVRSLQKFIAQSPGSDSDLLAELQRHVSEVRGDPDASLNLYEYAFLWVWCSEEGLPSGRERLLVRRSLSQEPEVKYHRAHAPAAVAPEKLAQVRGGHWSVEQSFEAGKGECGLDEYETRGWVGWHHHTALSLLALWFLGLQRRRLGEKRPADDRARGPGAARASA